MSDHPTPIDPEQGDPEQLDPDQLEADLAGVDAALQHIDAGTYGRCVVCNLVLDDAVLLADPTVSACPAHIHLRGQVSAG